MLICVQVRGALSCKCPWNKKRLREEKWKTKKKEVPFPGSSASYCRRRARRSGSETSGDSPYLAAKYGGGIFLLIYIIAGIDLRLHHDRGRDRAGTYDEKKPGRGVCLVRKSVLAVGRRLDQCDYPGADRAVLFRHRRLGHQISG